MRIERLRRAFDIRLRWIHFPLHPETPEEGQTLEELFAGRGVDIPAMMARMRAVAEAEGLPLGERHRTYNSRLAQELGKWAEEKDGGERIHDLLFRAYFVDGMNIGQVETLVELAQANGFPADEARGVLEERRFRDAVDRDWMRSRSLGITGVPTFVANGRGVVGAQPYEVLEQLVVEAGGRRCEDAGR